MEAAITSCNEIGSLSRGYCGLGYEHEVISVGTNHTLAVQADGSLRSWGRNDRGVGAALWSAVASAGITAGLRVSSPAQCR